MIAILSAKTEHEADKLLRTLENEELIEGTYNWITIKVMDDLNANDFSDDINADITRRILDDNIVYVGTKQEDDDV